LQLLALLRAGRPLADGVEPFPTSASGRPELLVGGASRAALRRAAEFADGVITFGVDADPASQVASFDVAHQAWRDRGRSGRPRFVAGLYFALGPDARERAGEHLGPYYEVLGREGRDWMIDTISLTTPDAVRAAISSFASAGVDELYLTPAIADIDQLHRLSEAVG
jgi:alkanesulfonate monooxygenase SsuD/methylene tetrahydromethanopterin reductase-like flavin-dependent oxidoreductase (luciferase family)